MTQITHRRMHRYIQLLFIAAACMLAASCSLKKKEVGRAPETVEQKAQRIVSNASVSDTLKPVATKVISNGVVKPLHTANLAFEVSLPVKQVCVRNGDHVKAGQAIAYLDTYQLQNSLQQSQRTLESSELEMKDVIISQGYDPKDMGAVPQKVKDLAQLKSGYNLKKTQVEMARYELKKGVLLAPISGVVADLAVRRYDVAQPGETVGRILDDSKMKVKFKVMEHELPLVKIGKSIVATPFADSSVSYKGEVIEINPVVEEDGSITIKGMLDGGKGLYDGMHVKIVVE